MREMPDVSGYVVICPYKSDKTDKGVYVMTFDNFWAETPIFWDIDDWPVHVGTFVQYQEQYENSDIVYQITSYTDNDGGVLTLSEVSDISGPCATWQTNPDKAPIKETIFQKLVAI